MFQVEETRSKRVVVVSERQHDIEREVEWGIGREWIVETKWIVEVRISVVC